MQKELHACALPLHTSERQSQLHELLCSGVQLASACQRTWSPLLHTRRSFAAAAEVQALERQQVQHVAKQQRLLGMQEWHRTAEEAARRARCCAANLTTKCRCTIPAGTCALGLVLLLCLPAWTC